MERVSGGMKHGAFEQQVRASIADQSQETSVTFIVTSSPKAASG